MDLIALTTVCLCEWWSWNGRFPLLPAAREGMVPVTMNHLLHWYDLAVAGCCGGATSTHFVDLLQHNIPISERACSFFFWMWGINGRWALHLGSRMISSRSPLDGVGLPAGTSSNRASCFLSELRKSPTSGFTLDRMDDSLGAPLPLPQATAGDFK